MHCTKQPKIPATATVHIESTTTFSEAVLYAVFWKLSVSAFPPCSFGTLGPASRKFTPRGMEESAGLHEILV